jgi:predicted RNA-binding Zn-ribbon protein involved in translation (DUF1610 family)
VKRSCIDHSEEELSYIYHVVCPKCFVSESIDEDTNLEETKEYTCPSCGHVAPLMQMHTSNSIYQGHRITVSDKRVKINVFHNVDVLRYKTYSMHREMTTYIFNRKRLCWYSMPSIMTPISKNIDWRKAKHMHLTGHILKESPVKPRIDGKTGRTRTDNVMMTHGVAMHLYLSTDADIRLAEVLYKVAVEEGMITDSYEEATRFYNADYPSFLSMVLTRMMYPSLTADGYHRLSQLRSLVSIYKAEFKAMMLRMKKRTTEQLSRTMFHHNMIPLWEELLSSYWITSPGKDKLIAAMNDIDAKKTTTILALEMISDGKYGELEF